ncbi:MAG: hypothetical protein JRD68_00815 [Deltaproteobacteria bacterium]|nr:hypothetical protein [Deltaproteobacteria bacterium]
MKFINKDTIFVTLVLLISTGLIMSGGYREPGTVTVSALILKVLAGSIGMVLVAPITAVTAGLLYHRFHGTPVETVP